MPRVRAIPEDLAGKTVLDLGGYNGDFARLCLQRGAVRAVVVDNGQWQRYGWSPPGPPEGFEHVDADLFQYDEPADVVIFYNVLYHLKDPFAGLAHVRKLTRETLLLCTSFVDDADRPEGWRWYPDGLGHANGTVWCRPTPTGLVRALHEAGFTMVEEVGRWGDHLVCRCH